MAERRGARVPLAFEQRITALTIALAVPAMLLGAILLYWLNLSPILRVCLFVMLVLIVGATAALLREVIVQPLRGLANVIEAYRAGDYQCGDGARAGAMRSASWRVRSTILVRLYMSSGSKRWKPRRCSKSSSTRSMWRYSHSTARTSYDWRIPRPGASLTSAGLCDRPQCGRSGSRGIPGRERGNTHRRIGSGSRWPLAGHARHLSRIRPRAAPAHRR